MKVFANINTVFSRSLNRLGSRVETCPITPSNRTVSGVCIQTHNGHRAGRDYAALIMFISNMVANESQRKVREPRDSVVEIENRTGILSLVNSGVLLMKAGRCFIIDWPVCIRYKLGTQIGRFLEICQPARRRRVERLPL